jgi:hypothetical protein
VGATAVVACPLPAALPCLASPLPLAAARLFTLGRLIMQPLLVLRPLPRVLRLLRLLGLERC